MLVSNCVLVVSFRVLYFSIHRYEYGKFWPNLEESSFNHVGNGTGTGYNINVPLNQTGLTDFDYLSIILNVLLPVAYEVSFILPFFLFKLNKIFYFSTTLL